MPLTTWVTGIGRIGSNAEARSRGSPHPAARTPPAFQDMIGRPSHRISIRRDLGLQLLALYLLFVGPIALAGVLFDAVSRQRLEGDVRAADLALARAIALESNDALSRAIHTVEQLALTSAVRQAELLDGEIGRAHV